MISLTDYYQPLNLTMITASFFIFLFFDIVGFSFAKKFIRTEDYLRPVNWVLGLGLFVFVWFWLHFRLPFRTDYVLLTALPFLIMALPYYLKNGGWSSLVGLIKTNPWPFLIALPLLPAVWVKASLPPYYTDEMAYQYISPYALKTWSNWGFSSGGLYPNLPHLLNTLWYLVFGLTKTYAPARLLHFLIYFTSLASIYLWLKKRINIFSALAFFGLFLYLPQDILMVSTLGYVDIGAIFTASLGVISLIDYLFNRRPSSLLAAAIFWGISVGIKNTTLTSLLSYSIIFLIFILIKKSFPGRRLFLSAILLFILLGGYWYVKNLILFYNPVFPFVFPCKSGLVEVCQKGSGFFEGWMEPINRQTFSRIFFVDLMTQNRNLVILFIANLLLLPFQKNKKIQQAGLFIIFAVGLEFFILKNFSGFYIRYHQLIQISLMILLVLQAIKPLPIHPFQIKSWNLLIIFSLSLFFVVGRNAYRLIESTYTSNYLKSYEVKYALGIMDIKDWIRLKFPAMKDVIFYCETPPDNKILTLLRLDPDLIWFTYEGQMRTFMTNCNLGGASMDGIPVGKAIEHSVKNKLKYYLVSLDPCAPPDKIDYKRETQFEYQRELRRLNNEVVCHSKEIIPHLYLFDWQDIKQ